MKKSKYKLLKAKVKTGNEAVYTKELETRPFAFFSYS